MIIYWYMLALITSCENNYICSFNFMFLFSYPICSYQLHPRFLTFSTFSPQFFRITSQTCEWVNNSGLAWTLSSSIITVKIVICVCCYLRGIINLNFIPVKNLYYKWYWTLVWYIITVRLRRSPWRRRNIETMWLILY